METSKLAVLIDADNAQASIAAELLAEISRYGSSTIRRAYGDWTTPNLVGWKSWLLDLAIQPVQQFRFTTGKNATDSALIIDAMDLLHTGEVDGFCIVSSDSDFTRLATRLRESGHIVYGFGERKTPKPFVAACDKFIYTELLRPDAHVVPAPAEPDSPLKAAFFSAIDGAAREDGWALLATVGALLVQADPAFDARAYGFKKLGDLARSQPYLEVKAVPTSEGAPTQTVYVRRGKA